MNIWHTCRTPQRGNVPTLPRFARSSLFPTSPCPPVNRTVLKPCSSSPLSSSRRLALKNFSAQTLGCPSFSQRPNPSRSPSSAGLTPGPLVTLSAPPHRDSPPQPPRPPPLHALWRLTRHQQRHPRSPNPTNPRPSTRRDSRRSQLGVPAGNQSARRSPLSPALCRPHAPRGSFPKRPPSGKRRHPPAQGWGAAARPPPWRRGNRAQAAPGQPHNAGPSAAAAHARCGRAGREAAVRWRRRRRAGAARQRRWRGRRSRLWASIRWWRKRRRPRRPARGSDWRRWGENRRCGCSTGSAGWSRWPGRRITGCRWAPPAASPCWSSSATCTAAGRRWSSIARPCPRPAPPACWRWAAARLREPYGDVVRNGSEDELPLQESVQRRHWELRV